jgi:hypothetical protein
MAYVMNPSEFTNFSRWQIEMVRQDHAVLLVTVIAAAALIWIILVRWSFVRGLPAFRVAIVGAYYAALALALLGAVH